MCLSEIFILPSFPSAVQFFVRFLSSLLMYFYGGFFYRSQKCKDLFLKILLVENAIRPEPTEGINSDAALSNLQIYLLYVIIFFFK